MIKARPILKLSTFYGGPMALDGDGRNPRTVTNPDAPTLKLEEPYRYPDHPGFEDWAEELLRKVGRTPMEGRADLIKDALQEAFKEGQGFVRAEEL